MQTRSVLILAKPSKRIFVVFVFVFIRLEQYRDELELCSGPKNVCLILNKNKNLHLKKF
jgi:hypothetical protein